MADFLNFFLVPALTYSCLYGLVATGLNVYTRSTHVWDLSYPQIMMWAPMAALTAYKLWGFGAAFSLAFGFLAAMAFAFLSEWIAIRPFIGKTSSALPWILSTLGMATVLGQLGSIPFGGAPEAFPLSFSSTRLTFGLLRVSPQQLLLFGLTIVVVASVVILYRWTRIGRMLSAVSEDFDGARALGISPTNMSQIAMAASAVIASLTGFVVAPILLVTPQLGFDLLFVGFVAAAVGGLGTLWGGILGGIFVGVVLQLTQIYVGGLWSNAFLFGALLVLYLVRPWGILGRRPQRAV